MSRKFPEKIQELSLAFPGIFRECSGNFRDMSWKCPENVREISRKFPGQIRKIRKILFLTPPGHFQPVLAMKFLVESEFRGQGPPRTQEIVKIDVNCFLNFLKNIVKIIIFLVFLFFPRFSYLNGGPFFGATRGANCPM